MPFGPFGEVAHALWVRRQLRTIFDFREQAIARLLAATAPQVAP